MAALGGNLVGERYAGALFELARGSNAIDAVEAGLERIGALVRNNRDMRRFVLSPVFSKAEQMRGLTAILKSAGISGVVHDFLLVLTRNRRLFAIEAIIKAFKTLAAKERGEVEAEVRSAVPLTQAQTQDLVDTLRQRLGKTPRLTTTVDPALLGGLIVRVGSQMIDTSLRTKLQSLRQAMKEAS